MIDVIIPTLWVPPGFEKALDIYCNNPHVSKIIIIDNAPKAKPSWKILTHAKISIVSYSRNIFVNPAWNEGVSLATAKRIALVNDDITIHPEVFTMVMGIELLPGDLIGVNLQGRQDNYKIDEYIPTKESITKLAYDPKQPIGSQAWAFGICMFMLRESYTKIPSLYQVWYGDDYLAQNAKNIFTISSNMIKGSISETLKTFSDPNSEVSKRIELDSKNLLRFQHFKDTKHWDIPRNIIKMYENQRKDIFAQEYTLAKNTPSDINQNVHILYELANNCNTVVEMGVRTGVSTRAFLNTKASLISFDIVLNPQVQKLFDLAKAQGKHAEYIQANVLDIEIGETDLLFIDTLHTYEQLKQELHLHGNKARKYLVFHDTYTFGLRDEVLNGNKGLLSAIIEFMIDNPHWKFFKYKTNNNGLTVLTRT